MCDTQVLVVGTSAADSASGEVEFLVGTKVHVEG
jgi:hypothetical protein